MPTYTLAIIDTIGVQDYIFASNRLRENIGASHLVELATRQWAYDVLEKDIKLKHNIKGVAKKVELDKELTIENHKLEAELIYAGGGNTVILFADCDKAKAFCQALSREVIREAPGLEIVVFLHSFEWSEAVLPEIMEESMKQLARKKLNRQVSAPLLGLGVTAVCESTGLPASYICTDPGGRKRIASAETKAKLDQVDEANKRLQGFFKDLDLEDRRLKYPLDLDDLGRTVGQESHIAVVHADGNGMAKRLKKIAEDFTHPDENRSYISTMRCFSESLERAASKALESTVKLLLQQIKDEKDQKVIGNEHRNAFELHQKKDENDTLPFRPLVFGGDDVTFVCDGRLSFALAAHYLTQFEEETKSLPDGQAHACAGIAIARAHYPFSRIYSLSEALCKKAKSYVKNESSGDGNDFSALDWHIAMSGISGSIEEIREREYTIREDYRLYMRPVHLRSKSNIWRAWDGVSSVIQEFQKDEKKWAERRNKVKALREALRKGPGAFEAFLRGFGVSESEVPVFPHAPDPVRSSGWDGKTCAYFDPIEAIDLYLPLD